MLDIRYAAAVALLLACLPVQAARAFPDSLILVAKPELRDPVYAKTVLVVKSFGGEHLGFIVNRPTRMTLGKLFPDHAPSQEIENPVFLGGPSAAEALFALVAGSRSPGRGSIEVIPGLFAVFDGRTVDSVIEANPEEARFMMGFVVWRRGELQHEIERGAWYVIESDSELALRDPKGLWEELVLRSRGEAERVRIRYDVSNHSRTPTCLTSPGSIRFTAPRATRPVECPREVHAVLFIAH